MKSRRELKNEAKALLKGRWGEMIALHALPIALAIYSGGYSMIRSVGGQQSEAESTAAGAGFDFNIPWGQILIIIGIVFLISFLLGLLVNLITTGISWTMLDLIRDNRTEVSPLRDNMRVFRSGSAGSVSLIIILVNIFISLWSILLVIPGIIKTFSYGQSLRIYYDAKESGEKLTALESITASRNLMNGHKLDLFVLELSFLGWIFLSIFTLGIGLIWVVPYMSATTAAFYDDLAAESNAQVTE